ncbi:RING finger protein 11 isoform X1 [Myxocyprinus asiaticus]|uniref:RING finger protein 11 isoform X1 n=1 Tax=Myxocyprinus asiaticus TaxID=70543 RepID=UPI002223DC4C|nr:RING finger protein 11 isoform X1 [Myxocyprinus asiaticus]
MISPCSTNPSQTGPVSVTPTIRIRNHLLHISLECSLQSWRIWILIGTKKLQLPNENKRYKEQIHVPVYHPTPSQARLATQLTEEEQVRIAQRIGLIQHLPKGVYDPGSDGTEKKIRECVICMMDFVYGDPIRFLPCMHIYHLDCIDDWLMRSFTCPSCMEPVDAALLSSYETN